MTAADGSVLNTFYYLRDNGGFVNLWPKPTLLACKIIAVYGVFEAALQLLLPGKTVYGPISPAGNRPVYKANGVAAYLVTLLTYVALWWSVSNQHYITSFIFWCFSFHLPMCSFFFRFRIFNPTIVYDHLGEIYSTLIFGSFIFCIFLYIKVSEPLVYLFPFAIYIEINF
jgi:7-dehydrocholesterol reductase